MGKINTDNYPNRPFSSYQDDDMFVLQDNGGETYTTNVGDIKDLIGEETDPKLALKVDKNGTDRLMTADEGTKLAGIAAGAQVNVLEGVVVDSIVQPISGKKAFIDLSGKTDLSVIAYTFNSEMGYFKGAYVTYNGKLYEFIQEHTGAWNPSHVREIRASGQYVRTGNGGYNNGDRATCEGYMTKASGNYSHAEGRETQAVGDCTHAEGRETIANGIYQHVEGKYNIADNESKYIHIIGNGIDDNNRNNAFAVDWEGNVEASGEIEDGNGEKISDKTDKVTNATSGHLAGLDSNGNLTDSGVSPTEDVTVEGNPVQFDSPFEQDAKSVVVSVKPIQAGSGTPSPENIRPISGTDEVEIEVSADGNIVAWSDFHAPTGTTKTVDENTATLTCDGSGAYQSIDDGGSTYQGFTPGTYRVRFNVNSINNTSFCHLSLRASNHSIKDSVQITGTGKYSSLLTISENCYLSWILNGGTAISNTLVVSDLSVEKVVTTTTIPLPSTLYDADVDVTEGSGENRYGYIASYNGETLPGAWISDRDVYTGSNSPTIGAEVAYELATPTTISFDPTDVELLEGTNVVSTNAEKVAVTYGRSLWQDIDDLKTDTEGKLDKSDVADVEGDTASKAYSVNDFMLRADGLYKVTAPIASGASITASNTTKTTVGEVLTALLNA